MSRLTIATSLSEMDRLRPAWEEMQAGCSTFFQRFAWNRLAAELLGESPHVVVAETSGGRAIVPAALTSDGINLLGDVLFDYRDILHAGESDALALALEHLAGLNQPLRVIAVRDCDHSELWSRLPRRRYSGAPGVRGEDISVDEFTAAHARLPAQLRRMERAGCSLKLYSGREEALVRHIFEQKGQQLAALQNNIFADHRCVEFMVAAIRAGDVPCEILTFESAGGLAAALVTLIDESCDAAVRRFYCVVFDAEWARFSPGTVLCFEAVRRSLAAGIDCDFMTGEQPYKLRFATWTEDLWQIDAPAGVIASVAKEVIGKPEFAHPTAA